MERVLDTYTLDEIIEENELTEEEVLAFLLEERFLKLPRILPTDVLTDE